MRIRAILLTLVCALAVSCSQKDEFMADLDSTSLKATMESCDALTKVGFTAENADFFWTTADAIGVTTTSTTTFLKMTLQGDGGNASGVFSGAISGEPSGYAVYPFGELGRHTLNGNVLTYNLPATYNYASLDSEYAKVDGNSYNAPMWGAIIDGSVAFKHLGGVMAVQVNDLPENKNNLKAELTATKQISGNFEVDLTTAEPVLVAAVAGTEADKTITINFSTQEDQTTGYFYFPLPTGNVGNLILTVTDSESNLLAIGAWDNKEVTRRMIARAVVGEQSVSGGEGQVKSVGNVSEIDESVLSTEEDNLVVKVTSELTGADNEITIPATLDAQTTTFSFASISNDAQIEINAAGNTYAGQVIIEIPVGATLPVVNANIPNGEVYIKQGTVTTLVVSSADNTTIIGEGATVTNLVVSKGNVRIKKDGAVTNITRSTDPINEDPVTYVVFEGVLPAQANDDQKIVYVSAAEWDLKKAIAKGGTVTLTEDITLESSCVITSDVTINLNGKSIKCASSDVFVVTAGTLIINGDGLVYGSEDNSSSSCAVWAKENGIVVINGGTYKVGHDGASKSANKDNWRNDCIYARDNARITINGGEFAYTGEINIENFQSDGNRFLLNCRDNDYKAGTSSITVTGGTFHKFNPGATSSENPVASYVAAGYSSVAGENDTYVVKEGIYNEAALKAAIDNGISEITLGDNITLSDVIKINKTVTINLNGKDIIHPETTNISYPDVFNVGKGGNLTILGEGRVISQKNNSIFASSDAKVCLKGGKYYSPLEVVYAQSSAVVTIEGGEYYADVEPAKNSPEHSAQYGHRFTLNLKDNTSAQIIVKGGKFYKYNPAGSESENPHANFVVPGYSSVANGDYYEVKEGIYNEAALTSAIVNGTEINLSADITLEKAIIIPTNITATIDLNGFDITAPNTDAFEVVGILTIKDNSNVGVVSAGTANPNASVCAVWANGGTVTINGGHYKVYSDANGKRNDCIYAGYNADNNDTAGKITINGGKFEYVWPESKRSGLNYNGDMFLLNCADKDLYQTLITINGGQFKNNAPSYEDTTPNGRNNKEVQLGEGKKVYNGETEVTAAHNATTDIWYVVK